MENVFSIVISGWGIEDSRTIFADMCAAELVLKAHKLLSELSEDDRANATASIEELVPDEQGQRRMRWKTVIFIPSDGDAVRF